MYRTAKCMVDAIHGFVCFHLSAYAVLRLACGALRVVCGAGCTVRGAWCVVCSAVLCQVSSYLSETLFRKPSEQCSIENIGVSCVLTSVPVSCRVSFRVWMLLPQLGPWKW